MLNLSKILLLLLIVNISNAFAIDKNEIFDKLKAKYSSLETISFDFVNTSSKNIRASITAKKGNKYKMFFNNRIIYCDSKTIWNYSINDHNVLISNYKNHKNGSVEQIFFDFVKSYSPQKISSSSNTQKSKNYLLELIPIEKKNDSFDKIEIAIDDALNIKSFTTIKNYQKNTFELSNIKLNEQIDDKLFIFENKENIEIIDLR